MAKDIISAKPMIKVRGELMDLAKPRLMGILNVTPDSFYDGSRMNSDQAVLERTEKMVDAGVDIVDIGGYSSRPGADHIDEDAELERVIPAIESIRKRFDVPISIDSFRANVAAAALDVGADIINDISGGDLDEKMFPLVIEKKLPYIMMHMRGTPQTMRELTDYEDLIAEMMDHFDKKHKYLTDNGVPDIIIDMGFGFAKTIDQNYEILRNLDYFKVLGCPVLAGLSRKSMIFRTLDTSPSEALNGTTVLNTIALMKGANILRVHDVKEAREVIALVGRTLNAI